MNHVIKLNNQTSIDLSKLIESKLLVQANSGGGKSWLIRRILEQSHGKVQQIVLDPEGEFSTLREKFDYVLAGKGGDTPADPRSAALLARKLLELNVSAIIDLYELPPQERKRFVRLFVDALVNAPKELWHPVLIVIDEAHVFVPEKDQSEAAGPVNDLASRGRKRGFGLVLATQRISKLAKDTAAECNNKLIGRTSQDIDMKRAADELGLTTKEQFFSLRKLQPGSFYAFGPAISDEVLEVMVGNVETSHPTAGSQSASKVAPPTPGILKVLGKLADLPKEAQEEARTVAEYKTQVAQLKRSLTLMESRLADAGRHGTAQPIKVEKIEVPTIGKRSLEKIMSFEGVMRKMIRDIKGHYEASEANVQRFEMDLDKLIKEVSKISNPLYKVTTPPVRTPELAKPVPPRQVNSDASISGPEKRILNAIAWMESIGVMEPEQTAVAFLAGYTYGGGGFNNPKGSLRSKGLLDYRGDRIALTEAGRSIAELPDTPLTTAELHQKVLARLPGPEQKLLRVLLEIHPNDISKDELAERTGYAPGSGGFNNPCGRLRTLSLVEYPQPGRVIAKKLLFLE